MSRPSGPPPVVLTRGPPTCAATMYAQNALRKVRGAAVRPPRMTAISCRQKKREAEGAVLARLSDETPAPIPKSRSGVPRTLWGRRTPVKGARGNGRSVVGKLLPAHCSSPFRRRDGRYGDGRCSSMASAPAVRAFLHRRVLRKK